MITSALHNHVSPCFYCRRAGRCVFQPERAGARGDSGRASARRNDLPVQTASPYDVLLPAVRLAMDKPFTGDLDETGEAPCDPRGRHV